MVVIRVAQEGTITITEGDPSNPTIYRVTDNEIVVDDAHVAAILAAVPGSSLKPEPEPELVELEAPAEE